MAKAKPRDCPLCKRHFPTFTMFRAHFFSGCCQSYRDGKHVSCSDCDSKLHALARAMSRAFR